MEILARCQRVKWIDDSDDAQTFVNRVLAPPMRKLAPAGAEVSVLFVTPAAIRRLNREYRGIDKPTDVLAFALEEAPGGQAGGPVLLGDIVINLKAARTQADARGTSARDEIALLLIHGLLHLLGYDHGEPAGTRRMGALQERWLRKLGFPPSGQAL